MKTRTRILVAILLAVFCYGLFAVSFLPKQKRTGQEEYYLEGKGYYQTDKSLDLKFIDTKPFTVYVYGDKSQFFEAKKENDAYRLQITADPNLKYSINSSDFKLILPSSQDYFYNGVFTEVLIFVFVFISIILFGGLFLMNYDLIKKRKKK